MSDLVAFHAHSYLHRRHQKVIWGDLHCVFSVALGRFPVASLIPSSPHSHAYSAVDPDWQVCAGDILPGTVGKSRCCSGIPPFTTILSALFLQTGQNRHVFAVCDKIATCSPTVRVPKPNCNVLLTCLWTHIFVSFL